MMGKRSIPDALLPWSEDQPQPSRRSVICARWSSQRDGYRRTTSPDNQEKIEPKASSSPPHGKTILEKRPIPRSFGKRNFCTTSERNMLPAMRRIRNTSRPAFVAVSLLEGHKA